VLCSLPARLVALCDGPLHGPFSAQVFSVLIGGILPFGAVFIELFFILTSMWLHQFYYLFGFLCLVFIILIITCAEITIVLCYFQLCSEDYHWWCVPLGRITESNRIQFALFGMQNRAFEPFSMTNDRGPHFSNGSCLDRPRAAAADLVTVARRWCVVSACPMPSRRVTRVSCKSTLPLGGVYTHELNWFRSGQHNAGWLAWGGGSFVVPSMPPPCTT
jgi:Endomembrane protein 70